MPSQDVCPRDFPSEMEVLFPSVASKGRVETGSASKPSHFYYK